MGVRPYFMKVASLIQAIEKAHAKGKNSTYQLVRAIPHYDKNTSDTFFEELNIPKLDNNLVAEGDSQAEQTAGSKPAHDAFHAGHCRNRGTPELWEGKTVKLIINILTTIKL